MKRSEMVCSKCIKYHAPKAECRATSVPSMVFYPDVDWCGEGVWHLWNEQYGYGEFEPFRWGEWEGEK